MSCLGMGKGSSLCVALFFSLCSIMICFLTNKILRATCFLTQLAQYLTVPATKSCQE